MAAGGGNRRDYYYLRRAASCGYEASWRNPRFSPRRNRAIAGDAGAQQIDCGFGGGHDRLLLRLHRAPLACRSQLCRAGHRRQLRDRDRPRQVPVEGARYLGALGWRHTGGLRRGAACAVTWLAVPALASAAYWLLAIVAAIRWSRQFHHPSRFPASHPAPPVSILKPVHGRDPHFYEAIRSHALQNYPQYEILFGVGRADDPAADDIRRLIAEFPQRHIRLIVTSTKMPNAKVGVLADQAAQARYPLLLINDSDILVEPDYLRQVTALLNDPGAGLVTCLYRAQSDNLPGR